MRKLTKIIAPALIAISAVGVTGTATAQNYDRTPVRAETIRQDINQLQRQIDRRDWRGRVSDREARALRYDVSRLQSRFRMYNRNGLNREELRILRNHIADIRTRLQVETRDRDNRRW